jgi:phosphoribosyl-AMP cyclohydrolase
MSAPETTGEERIGVPIAYREEQLEDLVFNAAGLIPAVVQEAGSNEVLMVAYMDREALKRTLSTGRTWFYSRSRKEYWAKGETSGNRQWVHSVAYDCEGNSLLVTVDQDGDGACHTGAHNCFFRSIGTP